MKTIKAVRIPCYGFPQDVELSPDQSGSILGQLQKEVKGYVEACAYAIPGVVVYVNEEGKLNGSAPNRAIYATRAHLEAGYQFEEGEVMDIIFGDCIAVGDDGEGGDRSLTDEEAALVKSVFHDPSTGLLAAIEAKLRIERERERR